MKKENDIQAELREWGSPLADMSRAMPYDIPTGYFESNIKEISFYTTDATLMTGSKEMPFDVPADFFASFPQQMLNIAKAENIGATLPATMPYSVPKGYFETLPDTILAQVKTKNKPAGKTIALMPRRWMRQAVAAILLVALGVGYEYTSYRHLTPERKLAKVPQKSVQEYVHQNLNDMDTEQPALATDVTVVDATKRLDKNDIEQYLEETGLKTEYNIN